METRKQLLQIFTELDERLGELDRERRELGGLGLTKTRVEVLGQMSLLANRQVSAVLSLAYTADLDAKVEDGSPVRFELQKILAREGLVLDPSSNAIWIPPDGKFERMCDLKFVEVELLDAESALVSKAVKAPGKNKELLQEAIASDHFPTLVERILRYGGKLEDFV